MLYCIVYMRLYGYGDYDVDGVDDSVDLCPNTPFDVIVDERGCEEGYIYKGTLTLSIGSITGIDKQTKTLTNALVFIDYRYDAWDISFSTFNDIQNSISSVPDTFYVTTGYHYLWDENVESKLLIGTKQSSVQNDYFVSTYFTYQIDKAVDIFCSYTYTVAQDSNKRRYDNFYSFSLGTGAGLTSFWYSALSYDFAQASLPKGDNYSVITSSNTFNLSSSYFILFNYSYGLSKGASDHTLSLQFGVHFE